jgi:hypothetical protein
VNPRGGDVIRDVLLSDFIKQLADDVGQEIKA